MKDKRYWRNVVEVPADGKRGVYKGAFTLAFVYAKKGNFLVKGFHREVEKWIKDNIKSHYFVNYSLYSTGTHRDIWDFWKEEVFIREPDLCSRSKYNPENRKWKFYKRGEGWSDSYEKELKFKRLPKKWVPELDDF